MWSGNFWMGGMWIFPVIMMIAILIFIFWIVMIISRGSYGPFWYHRDRGDYPPEPNETPLEILKKRYARGEITKEEFERIKKDVL